MRRGCGVIELALVSMPGTCIATVASIDRVDALHRLASTWDGELSVAFLTQGIADAVEKGEVLKARQHLVIGNELPPAPGRLILSFVDDVGYRWPNDRFPTNMLRNIASAACSEEMDVILTLDVDFELCCGTSTQITSTIEQLSNFVRADPNTSIVLPAFDYRGKGHECKTMLCEPWCAHMVDKPWVAKCLWSGSCCGCLPCAALRNASGPAVRFFSGPPRSLLAHLGGLSSHCGAILDPS